MKFFKRHKKKLKRETMEVRSVLGNNLLEHTRPPLNEAELDVISAEQAALRLRNGEPLLRKRIIGDVLLGKEGLGYNIEFQLEGNKIAMPGISAPPQFERVPFTPGIRVEDCVFEGRLQFAGVWFDAAIQFSGTIFGANVEFQYSAFSGSVLFHRCDFKQKANFGDCLFYEMAHFDRSHFTGPADFYNDDFTKGASFAYTVFLDSCNLSRCQFKSTEILPPSLDFRNSVCHEAAYLVGSNFANMADLTGAQFRRQADFSDAQFQYVNFAKAEFGRLDLKWEQIAGNKLLFERMFLELGPSKPVIEPGELNDLFAHREQTPLPDKHRQYDILKAIFTKQGDHVSADGCYYEWKQVERRESPLGLSPERWIIKAFHYLNWLSCGYGIKPMRTLLFGLGTITVFAIAFALVDLWFVPNNPALTLIFGKFPLSFLTFMSFGGMPSSLYPISQFLYWTERMLGWLTLILFVTTYRRLMER